MIEDIRAVMWKEWKGLFRQRGSRMRALLTLLTPIAIFGLWFPWEVGANWFTRFDSIFAAVVIPLMVSLLTVPDSFAGERERHTLPTLLASRLPDRAILFGKIGFALVLSLGLALIVLVLGLAIANIAAWSGSIRVYSGTIALVDLSFCTLIALLTAGVGVLLSLRSVTVQEAQQTLAAVLLLPPTLLGPIVVDLALLWLAMARFQRSRLISS